MKNIETIQYSARFPYTWLEFKDSEMPFYLRMKTFNPFIPHDMKNSSLPGIYFNFEIISNTSKQLYVTIIAVERNLTAYHTNKKTFKTRVIEQPDYIFCEMTANVDKPYSNMGQMGIGVMSGSSSYYAGWTHLHPFYEYALRNFKLPNLDDTEGYKPDMPELPADFPKTDGRNMDHGKAITDESMINSEQGLYCAVASSIKLQSGQKSSSTFLTTWYYPNHYSELNADERIDNGETPDKLNKVGHYYENFFGNATEVASYMKDNFNTLSLNTSEFQRNFYASTVPVFILNQVNSQLNSLITNCSLSKNGAFGVNDDGGLVGASVGGPVNWLNLDVNIYGSILYTCLFPELLSSALEDMRERQHSDGSIGGLRSDWPSDYIQVVMSLFFWTNDTAYLRSYWQSIKNIIQYSLDKLDRDKDQMPEIYSHNNGCSYDNIPMHGMASYIQSQWLSAIEAAMSGAETMHDWEAAKEYKKIFEKGKKLMVDKLWTGEYFRLYNNEKGYFGINNGCLTDQLFGQWIALQSNLGSITDEDKIEKSITAVIKNNFENGYMLKNCSYPGEPFMGVMRDSVWNDQDNTSWSGVELAFASFMLYRGHYNEALQIIQTVEDRYRKNGLYWSHQEAAGHYIRDVSAWGIINGLLGLSVNQGEYYFNPVIKDSSYTLFFALPSGTFHFICNTNTIEIKVLTGKWPIRKIILPSSFKGMTKLEIKPTGKTFVLKKEKNKIFVEFEQNIVLEDGNSIVVK